MRRKIILGDFWFWLLKEYNALNLKDNPIKDNVGKEIYVNDWIEILSVPLSCADLIGRKYKVLLRKGKIELVNKKYKEKWTDQIPAVWYLNNKRCKVI